MRRSILVITTYAASIAFSQACNDSENSKATTSDTATYNDAMTSTFKGDAMAEHNQVMKKLRDEINTMTMTGDFDLDFAIMMMTHHNSAVDMAEKYLPKGKDEKIKSMAQVIFNSQKKEIEELKVLVANHNTGRRKDAHAEKVHGDGERNELMEAMNTMMDKLKGLQMSGDIDIDFVTMMIPHHESAVMMAQSEISQGSHSDFKKRAQIIIVDQGLEIKRFQEWVAKTK